MVHHWKPIVDAKVVLTHAQVLAMMYAGAALVAAEAVLAVLVVADADTVPVDAMDVTDAIPVEDATVLAVADVTLVVILVVRILALPLVHRRAMEVVQINALVHQQHNKLYYTIGNIPYSVIS
jgi:hypothetical protein